MPPVNDVGMETDSPHVTRLLVPLMVESASPTAFFIKLTKRGRCYANLVVRKRICRRKVTYRRMEGAP